MANLTLYDLASSVTCDILTPLDPSIPMQSRNLRGGPAWDFSNLFNASPPRLPDYTARGSLGNAGRSMFRTMDNSFGRCQKGRTWKNHSSHSSNISHSSLRCLTVADGFAFKASSIEHISFALVICFHIYYVYSKPKAVYIFDQ